MFLANLSTDLDSQSLLGVFTTCTFGGRVGMSLGGVLGQMWAASLLLLACVWEVDAQSVGFN
jgi:hypothetical protein